MAAFRSGCRRTRRMIRASPICASMPNAWSRFASRRAGDGSIFRIRRSARQPPVVRRQVCALLAHGFACQRRQLAARAIALKLQKTAGMFRAQRKIEQVRLRAKMKIAGRHAGVGARE